MGFCLLVWFVCLGVGALRLHWLFRGVDCGLRLAAISDVLMSWDAGVLLLFTNLGLGVLV